LNLTNGSIFEGSEADLGTRPILVNFENMALDVKDYVEGEDVKNTYIKDLISDLSLSFRESRYSPTTCKGVMKSIDIKSEGEKSEVCIQTRNGMVLKIHEIEDYYERDRSIKWGPRPIDLDILFFDDWVYNSKTLTIPHADMENRMFVLEPLSQLCADHRHPVWGKTVEQMKSELLAKGNDEIIKMVKR